MKAASQGGPSRRSMHTRRERHLVRCSGSAARIPRAGCVSVMDVSIAHQGLPCAVRLMSVGVPCRGRAARATHCAPRHGRDRLTVARGQEAREELATRCNQMRMAVDPRDMILRAGRGAWRVAAGSTFAAVSTHLPCRVREILCMCLVCVDSVF